MKSIKFFAAIAALVAPFTAAQAVQGLNGAYYVGNYPAPTSGTPAATFITNTVCFPGCGYDTGDGVALSTFLGVPQGYTTNLSNELPYDYVGNHALTLSGFINSTGTHSFGLYSDDGSRLYIDGNLIVDNSGQHSPSLITANNVSLSSGFHSILIYQDENGGGTALTAYMDGNALSGSVLSTVGNVPEPATWGLMIGGFGVVGAVSRRRRAVTTVTA
ncbi:hypothetical protein SPAN111604_04725 [Sphingomonas antarctica]|uniref:PEPxxWA-CTERM sorting domain-containing protein n=1 Tax=Sphingomonas antarctica TaxID=2040274 RepID=UPI0039EB98A0